MEALSIIQRAAGMEPVEAGIVLGSGLGQLGEQVTGAVSVPYEALPGFPKGGVSGTRAGSSSANSAGGASRSSRAASTTTNTAIRPRCAQLWRR